jgi:hypothetical protein
VTVADLVFVGRGTRSLVYGGIMSDEIKNGRDYNKRMREVMTKFHDVTREKDNRIQALEHEIEQLRKTNSQFVEFNAHLLAEIKRLSARNA